MGVGKIGIMDTGSQMLPIIMGNYTLSQTIQDLAHNDPGIRKQTH